MVDEQTSNKAPQNQASTKKVKKQINDKPAQFVKWLERFNPKENEGANRKVLAELRRSLSFDPGSYLPAYPYVEPFFSKKAPQSAADTKDTDEQAMDDEVEFSAPDSNISESEKRKRDMYYVVAGLYALHPAHGNKNIAEALHTLKSGNEDDSFEKRFLALLSTADDTQLLYHLRQMIGILKQAGSSFDYAQLLRDLIYWHHYDQFVQRRWAQYFYRYRAPETSD